MKGDFSRNTYNPGKRYSRVLMQQGRVQLDADWNEQGAVFTHYLRALAADLIGPHGGPGDGFKVHALTDAHGHPVPGDFSIQAGHYYVDGILCESEEPIAYTQQPAFPFPGVPALEAGNTYVVYLDVWERHVSYVEDAHIREVALGGADTATRAQVVWQVKVLSFEWGLAADEVAERTARLQAELRELMRRLEEAREAGDRRVGEELQARIEALTEELQSLETGLGIIRLNSASAARVIGANRMRWSNARLRARARTHPSPAGSDVVVSDAGGYSGAENRLYRVEIHNPSAAGQQPTFKWSRENGSVVFPVLSLHGKTATVAHLGRDHRRSVEAGDWVEIVDDERVLRGQPGPLVQVERIDGQGMTVVFTRRPGVNYSEHSYNHPLLRRWDQRPEDAEGHGSVPIMEGEGDENWIALEHGIQVQFQPGGQYRSGDYWCIPARTAIADIEWPRRASGPEAIPPQGVEHHYAPLAIISVAEGGAVQGIVDCRHVIQPLGKPVQSRQNAWGHPETGFA